MFSPSQWGVVSQLLAGCGFANHLLAGALKRRRAGFISAAALSAHMLPPRTIFLFHL